jgi:hypothetical protein
MTNRESAQIPKEKGCALSVVWSWDDDGSLCVDTLNNGVAAAPPPDPSAEKKDDEVSRIGHFPSGINFLPCVIHWPAPAHCNYYFADERCTGEQGFALDAGYQYLLYLQATVGSEEPAAAPVPAGPRRSSADLLPHNAWQGRDIDFMRSNEHSRERNGTWNTDGLDGAALRFVSGDKKAAKCDCPPELVSVALCHEQNHTF